MRPKDILLTSEKLEITNKKHTMYSSSAKSFPPVILENNFKKKKKVRKKRKKGTDNLKRGTKKKGIYEMTVTRVFIFDNIFNSK